MEAVRLVNSVVYYVLIGGFRAFIVVLFYVVRVFILVGLGLFWFRLAGLFGLLGFVRAWICLLGIGLIVFCWVAVVAIVL